MLTSRSLSPSLSTVKVSLEATKDLPPNYSFDVWKVDEDSADLEVESSAEKMRREEAVRKEEERRRAEEEAARLKAEAEKNELLRLAAMATATAADSKKSSDVMPVAPVAPKNVTTAPIVTSTGRTSGFDVGLLVALPLMVGALGFFLFFPLIAESLYQAGDSLGQ